MRNKNLSKLILLAGIFAFWGAAQLSIAKDEKAPADDGAKALKVLEMKKIEDGNYLVQMEQGGETIHANFEVRGGRFECVSASEDVAIGMRGESIALGNGVFMVRVRNQKVASSQFWSFGIDGSARNLEVPDRGENHRVWRVSDGDVLEPPAEKKS